MFIADARLPHPVPTVALSEILVISPRKDSLTVVTMSVKVQHIWAVLFLSDSDLEACLTLPWVCAVSKDMQRYASPWSSVVAVVPLSGSHRPGRPAEGLKCKLPFYFEWLPSWTLVCYVPCCWLVLLTLWQLKVSSSVWSREILALTAQTCLRSPPGFFLSIFLTKLVPSVPSQKISSARYGFWELN